MSDPVHPVQFTVESLEAALTAEGYMPTRDVCVAGLLMDALEKPLLLEGPAGVGKTELAKALAKVLDRPLIRLQCYEGLDESRALYEWEYGKQLLYTEMLRPLLHNMLEGERSLHGAVEKLASEESALFHERFLLERPIVRAMRSAKPALLLIDEVDRADPEFEALLLEVLSDFQVSVPELGTIVPVHRPRVVLTTNGTRELTDALRRRCLYTYIDYPERSRELSILRHHVPEASSKLANDVVDFVARVRELDLRKAPSVSETVDWARTLVLMSASDLEGEYVAETLGALLKHREDFARVEALLRSNALN